MAGARERADRRRSACASIVLPQAFRAMMPVLLMQCDQPVFKSTSLVYVIGLRDFLTAADLIGGRDNRLTEMYVLVAVVFFVICWTASQAVGLLERRIAAVITLDHVSKWYGPTQVLDDCSTRIAQGEVVVVCGPSGSGKSTLIKCVNGLEPFQKGVITVDGISVGDPRPTCRSCARASAWCSRASSSIRI